jgi:serine protease Do
MSDQPFDYDENPKREEPEEITAVPPDYVPPTDDDHPQERSFSQPFEQPAPPAQSYAYGYQPPQPPYGQPQANIPPAPQQVVYSPYPQQQPVQTKRKKHVLLIFCLAILVLLGLGIFIGVLVYQNSLTPPTGAQTTNAQNAEKKGADTTLSIQSTPNGDASVAAVEGALTPVEIGVIARRVNVAVQVYSGRSDSLMGEGSGVIAHEDKTKTYTYVVTCAHVIDGYSRVSIELQDGTRYDAEVVGSDARTDVAVLRVKKTGLNGATFGDSSVLKVGEPVYAIGNPGGAEFKGSLTDGMVSAIDRPITSTYKTVAIQHNAAINPGNSGGALFNVYGQVIGINSQKIAATEYEGMGFAIPSKTTQEIVNALIQNKYVPNRPKLGIQYLPASQTQTGYYVVRMNDLPSGSLIIAEIDDDSVLKGTDVRANDIITHVNGQALKTADVLLAAVENGKVGDELKLSIFRVSSNYETTAFEVTVKLVEDKGTTAETTTEPDIFDFFGDYGY